jgi:hypothetical protein
MVYSESALQGLLRAASDVVQVCWQAQVQRPCHVSPLIQGHCKASVGRAGRESRRVCFTISKPVGMVTPSYSGDCVGPAGQVNLAHHIAASVNTCQHSSLDVGDVHWQGLSLPQYGYTTVHGHEHAHREGDADPRESAHIGVPCCRNGLLINTKRQLPVKALEPTYGSATYRFLSVESTQTEGVPRSRLSPKTAKVPGPSL